MAKGTYMSPKFNTRQQNEAERQYSHAKGDGHPPKALPEGWLAEVRRRRRAAS